MALMAVGMPGSRLRVSEFRPKCGRNRQSSTTAAEGRWALRGSERRSATEVAGRGSVLRSGEGDGSTLGLIAAGGCR